MYKIIWTVVFWLAVSAAAGLVAHHGLFIRGKWHVRVPRVVLGHIALACVVWSLVPNTSDDPTKHSRMCFVMYTCYLASLFSGMTIYRLFFHRLRHFPGPKLAALTEFWHVFEARHSTNYRVMQRVHEEYGTFVITGPNEISIFHPAAIESLDGPKNDNIKDPWYDVLEPRTSPIFTRSEDDRRARRQVWSHAISTQCKQPRCFFHLNAPVLTGKNAYAPRQLNLIETLARCIASYDSNPVKINDNISWSSFDAMGDLTFGHDFWHDEVEPMAGGY
ncbi:MAG: hypothetical protein M1816_004124 [Peltula sp. TS41687]|nr:MAG: hypothetical protein M1816_004124 [Peltula sp. TS41687]